MEMALLYWKIIRILKGKNKFGTLLTMMIFIFSVTEEIGKAELE